MRVGDGAPYRARHLALGLLKLGIAYAEARRGKLRALELRDISGDCAIALRTNGGKHLGRGLLGLVRKRRPRIEKPYAAVA